MPWVLLATVAFGAPPPDLNLDDDAVWASAADPLLDGPPGCWEVVGRASWRHDLGRFGAYAGDAVVVGRLVDGVWSQWKVFPLGELTDDALAERYEPVARATPLLGRVRGLQISMSSDGDLDVHRTKDERVEPASTVRDVLATLGDVETSWASWSDEDAAVLLTRQLGDGRRGTLTRTQWFPGGGAVPTSEDLALDGVYHPKGIPFTKVTDLSVQLRGVERDGVVLPSAETMRFTLSLPTLTVTAAQTIRYVSVVRCVDDAVRRPPSADR